MPRDWDNESVRSGPRNYTTVRRYKVPDRGGDYEDDRYETDIKITNRDGERDIIYERESDRGRGGRNVREIKVTRELDRAPSPPSPAREWRVEREGPRGGGPYELERYSRETEYVREPDRIQPIIIRQEAPAPIIIRESAAQPQQIVIREEPRYEGRSDDNRSVANRSIVRREPSPESDEEDYYYKRTTRQVARRNDGREDERDNYRREVDPRDAVSQYHDDRRDDQYSDDEVYYKKTTEEWNEQGSRDHSPKHKLHLAEGAIAGLAAGALLNRRQKQQGGKGGGAVQLVGGAALGAAATEVITRLRNRSQSRGRQGGGSNRSRSHSGGNRISDLAKVGAVAALGALAGYAVNKKRKENAVNNERRSRSRHRQSSVARGRGASESESDSDGAKARNQKATIAKAGLASAAVAGLIDRVRSRSRGAQSQSLARSALPVAAAGLGGAAIAGLYQKNKEKKQQQEREQGRSRSRTRRRSRSRSQSAQYSRGDPGASGANQQNLVVYGGDPITPGEQYARPRSRADSYYSDPGNRSRRASPDSSGSNSPRHRSRSRARNDRANAGGGSGSSANEASLRRERKRAERERRRVEEERNETPQGWGPYAQPNPVPIEQNQYFPQTFPPPPQSPVHAGNNYNYPQYGQAPQAHYHNPADYPAHEATSGNPPQPQAPGANGGQWNTAPGQQQQQGYFGNYNVSRAFHTSEQGLDGRVRDLPQPSTLSDTPKQRRKSVQFGLDPTSDTPVVRSGAIDRAGDELGQDRNNGNYCDDNRRSQSADDARPSRYSPSRYVPTGYQPEAQTPRKQDRGVRLQKPQVSEDSEEIEVLPDRFHRDGRRKLEQSGDPLTDVLQNMLSGEGPAREVFQRFANDILGLRSSRR